MTNTLQPQAAGESLAAVLAAGEPSDSRSARFGSDARTDEEGFVLCRSVLPKRGIAPFSCAAHVIASPRYEHRNPSSYFGDAGRGCDLRPNPNGNTPSKYATSMPHSTFDKHDTYMRGVAAACLEALPPRPEANDSSACADEPPACADELSARADEAVSTSSIVRS